MEPNTSESLRTDYGDAVQMGELPFEAWCASLSFVLRSSHCLSEVSAVSRLFCEVSGELLSWQGSSVCIGPTDLELAQGHHRFERLVPKWTLCEHVFLNFDGAHAGARRAAARQCLQMIASRCSEVSCVAVRNWFLCEPQGLPVLHGTFPKLRHLELNGCDQISTYSAMVPVFEQHPTLLSLRASFQPRAVAGEDFALAVPRTLMALGFVNFESAETLAILLERCTLEHFWFSANSVFTNGVRLASGLDCLKVVLRSGLQQVRTLALPSDMPEDVCAALVSALCPKVELLCRMRIGSPAFGTGALAGKFEEVQEGGGVVVRRRGTSAGLASNGALWAPYTQGDSDMVTLSPSPNAQAQSKQAWSVEGVGHRGGARQAMQARHSCARAMRDTNRQGFATFAEELAVRAAARQQ